MFSGKTRILRYYCLVASCSENTDMELQFFEIKLHFFYHGIKILLQQSANKCLFHTLKQSVEKLAII